MDRLFTSLRDGEPGYRRITLRTSLLFAVVSAFIAGAEMVRITAALKGDGVQEDLAFEVVYLVLWLGIGLRWGRGVWESTRHTSTQTEEGTRPTITGSFLRWQQQGACVAGSKRAHACL